MKRALILFAGIGGFCQNIDFSAAGFGEIIAVEIAPEIAKCYKDRFPTHRVFTKGGEVIFVGIENKDGSLGKKAIISPCDDSYAKADGDAHLFLQMFAHEFDFIQSSPPCQTHSRQLYGLGVCGRSNYKPDYKYPDAMLWQEIIWLSMNPNLKKDCVWLVENVNPYYEGIVKFAPQKRLKLGRHFIWTNAELMFFDYKNVPKAPSLNTKNKLGRITNMSVSAIIKENPVYSFIRDYPEIKNKRQVLRNIFEPELAAYVFNAIYKDAEYHKLACERVLDARHNLFGKNEIPA
jgi:DNA (cytosine-5)-methyltransferase 1